MDALRVAQERLRRFERLGGVDLSRLEPEEKNDLDIYTHVGLANYKKAIFWYRCEECGKKESSDLEMEPACTGPSWTDDHPMSIMTFIGRG